MAASEGREALRGAVWAARVAPGASGREDGVRLAAALLRAAAAGFRAAGVAWTRRRRSVPGQSRPFGFFLERVPGRPATPARPGASHG